MKRLLRKLHLLPLPEASRQKPKASRDLTVANARLSYPDYVAKLLTRNEPAAAMALAVGGDYEIMGEALRSRLVSFGLQPNDYLIDVGCGSGRLAAALARSDWRETICYLGIDVVREMLTFAAAQCRQPRWRFEEVNEPHIPESDGVADMVCFFSVFTHLLEEESYLYLQEARRV
ncbi:MAG: class I SAM-dependent methyltransferase, partial [Chthoniobacterales bacterium]